MFGLAEWHNLGSGLLLKRTIGIPCRSLRYISQILVELAQMVILIPPLRDPSVKLVVKGSVTKCRDHGERPQR